MFPWGFFTVKPASSGFHPDLEDSLDRFIDSQKKLGKAFDDLITECRRLNVIRENSWRRAEDGVKLRMELREADARLKRAIAERDKKKGANH
jgi:hypothetical protein